MPSQVDALMTELSSRNEWPAPRSDSRGRYSLVVDGGMELTVFQAGRELFLESRIGPVPEEKEARTALVGGVLRSQLARLGRRSEVLCIDPEGSEFVLFRRVSAGDIDARRFEEILGAFVNSVEFWNREVSGAKPEPVFQPAMRVLFP